MPGILPMKVIKVGTSSQSRIAQACDRCRSKKIRCDGIRPCCSQCSNVGFECKTSDKLSRRAFPRGYTESLEERVRQLEAEVRELKDLLDEKDEKIDMLSKMHGNRRPSVGSPHSSSRGLVSDNGSGAGGSNTPSPGDVRKELATSQQAPKEDVFRVQASPLLLGVENSDSYFMGASSGRAFIETFKRKLQENGKSCPDFNPEAFLHIQGCYPLIANAPTQTMRVPPRMFSDRCVNIYFQEWAPLFPVLHKPTFLRIYEEFVADPDKVKNNHKLAQLYLVFSIAALSSELPDNEQIAVCELQWQRALEPILMDNTMHTLQCLVLALMYCTVRADYKRLQHYKGIAVVLSHRLGLHQSQKRFSFGALTIETRKKVFWTLYTVDCFSAAILGLPKLMKEDDIHAEYPSDTDDEYVTEKGFQPTLPGEYTKLSSALALFRGSRILAKVLEKIYPAAASHELSLQQMFALDSELEAWSDSLPPHLKLTFAQDKPSTDVTGSRSPLLALAYYYTRTLIFRPAVGSSLGQKATPALINAGDAAKHVIQIVQLLEERSMSFSFCMNKQDVMVLCGMTLLYQSLELKQESKISKDGERHVNGVIKMMEKARTPGTYDFKRVAAMLMTIDEASPLATGSTGSTGSTGRQSPDSAAAPNMSAPAAPSQQRASPPLGPGVPKKKLPQQQQQQQQQPKASIGRHASASVSETDLLQQQEKLRRMTMPNIPNGHPELYRSRSRPSFDGVHPTDQVNNMATARAGGRRVSPTPHTGNHTLDYLSLGNTPTHSHPPSPNQNRLKQQHAAAAAAAAAAAVAVSQAAQQNSMYAAAQLSSKVQQAGVSHSEWESLLSSMDGGQINVYDAIYGGPALSLAETPVSSTSNYSGWSPDSWDLAGFSIGDFTATPPGAPQSVLSLSDESLSSSDELAPSELSAAAGMTIDFRNQLIQAGCAPQDGFILDGLEANFSL